MRPDGTVVEVLGDGTERPIPRTPMRSMSEDYAAVVKALSPLRAALTTSEAGKLEYAEKQIQRTNCGD